MFQDNSRKSPSFDRICTAPQLHLTYLSNIYFEWNLWIISRIENILFKLMLSEFLLQVMHSDCLIQIWTQSEIYVLLCIVQAHGHLTRIFILRDSKWTVSHT